MAAAVNFTVTATDNCAGPVSLVCTPPSGSLFPLGTNTVTCVATDACGNTNSVQLQRYRAMPACVQRVHRAADVHHQLRFSRLGQRNLLRRNVDEPGGACHSCVRPSIRLAFSSITYFIGSTNFLRMPGQVFPEFDGFPPDYYTNMLWTVTARDNHGGVFVRQEVFHYDFTPPDDHLSGRHYGHRR